LRGRFHPHPVAQSAGPHPSGAPGVVCRNFLSYGLCVRLASRAVRRPIAQVAARRRTEVGEYRARTGDLLVANQALSQLS